MAEEKKEKIRVRTPEFRCAFMKVFPSMADTKDMNGKPFIDRNGKEQSKFSVVMLYPKDQDSDWADVKKLVKRTAKEKWGDNIPKKNFDWPFKDGDDKDHLDGYPGSTYVTASTRATPPNFMGAPGVVGPNLELITNIEDFKSGDYGQATVSAYAWEFKNKQGVAVKSGVSIGLENIQKRREGEPFGFVKGDPTGDFDPVETGASDPSNYEKDDSDDLEDDDFMN